MGKRKTAFTAVISATIALLLIMALLIISIEMFALNEQFLTVPIKNSALRNISASVSRAFIE